MTKLKKPVRRVAIGVVKDGNMTGPVVIELRPPNLLCFRIKGCKREYNLTVEVCYFMAVRAQALSEEKAKKTKAGNRIKRW